MWSSSASRSLTPTITVSPTWKGSGGEHSFTLGISALELVAAAHVACSLKDQLCKLIKDEPAEPTPGTVRKA